MPTSDSRDYELIDRLAEEFAQRFRDGERPSVQEYCDKYPSIAGDLRDMLPALAEVEQVKDQAAAPPLVEPPKLRQVDEYHILREVGRGGMGVVYEAEDTRLARRVALKVLATGKAGHALERFKREAKAAARLHHTNIVPVFGVGDHDGLPYYVMQFIQGLGLDEVLEEVKRLQAKSGSAVPPSAVSARPARKDISAAAVARSLVTGTFDPPAREAFADTLTHSPSADAAAVDRRPAPPPSGVTSGSSISLPGQSNLSGRKLTYWQSVAQIGLQVADALEYAHKQGILHRDIKPSNLLLDLHGVVWVTDFGLAKTDDQENLTHTGDVLGTLRYMPPEAFEGRNDARSDVYSLGLTMYELLALRPAFDERKKEALVKQVTTTDPARLGALNRAIPRDLGTIVHKAIEKDPGHRYKSAADLGADLRRFLADQTIQARRVSPGERVARWCRRNPTVAALSATVFVLLASAAVVSSVLALRVEQKAREAQAAADRATAEAERANEEANRATAATGRAGLALAAEGRERQRAEANAARARAAVDDYLNRVTDSDALKAPGLQPLRRDLLASARKFYEEFVRERGDDPALRREMAAIHLRVAKIQTEMGNTQESRQSARAAVGLFEALSATAPDDDELTVALIEAYDRAGNSARAIAVGERLVATRPDNRRAKEELAGAHNSLGRVRSDLSDHVGSIQAFERSLGLREELFRADPGNAEYEYGVAVALNNIGTELGALNRAADALVMYRRGADHARGLFQRDPRNYQRIRLYMRGLNNSSAQEQKLGLHEQALKTNRDGLDLTRRLTESDPTVPEYAYFFHRFAYNRAQWLDFLGRDGEALAAYRVAVAASQVPLLGTSDMVGVNDRIYFVIAAARAAELAGGESKSPSPAELADRDQLAAAAVDLLRQALQAGYRNPQFLKTGKQLNVLRPRADFQELLALADKGKVPTPAKPTAQGPKGDGPPEKGPVAAGPAPPNRGDAAASRYALGMVQLEFGLSAKAEQSLAEARQGFEALAREEPANRRHQLDLARTHLAFGDVRRQQRRFPEALAAWAVGRDLMQGVLKAVPADDPIAVEAASLLVFLGDPFVTNAPRSEADPALAACLDTAYGATGAQYLYHGLNRLAAGDLDGYRRTCERMLNEARLRRDDAGWFAADAAVVCAASPESKIDPARFLPLAERGAAEANSETKQYRTIYLALAQYRAGKSPEALKSLAASDRAAQLAGAPWNQESVLAAAVRALALHATDRVDEAKTWLATARRRHAAVEYRILMRKFGDDGLPNQLYLDLVRHVLREACQKVADTTFRDDQWRACPRIWGEIQYGRPDRARAAIDGMGPIDPADADLLAARGFLRGLLGDREAARADLEAGLRIAPDHVLARLGRGSAALADRPEEAAEDLVAALKWLPDRRTHDADRLVVDDLLAPSDRAFRRAVELRPADLQLWTARGRYLAWNGRWAEAAEAYAKGMGDRPIFIDWEEYAGALVLAGDLAGYRKLCARLEELVKSPAGATGPWGENGAFQVAVQMAFLHPDSGVDPRVYLGWANTLLSRDGNNAFVQFAAGGAANRAGKPDRALGHIRRMMRAIPLWDAREVNYYQMAMAHARLGDADEARRWFDLAEARRLAKFVEPRPATAPAHVYANVIIEAEVFRQEAERLIGGKK